MEQQTSDKRRLHWVVRASTIDRGSSAGSIFTGEKARHSTRTHRLHILHRLHRHTTHRHGRHSVPVTARSSTPHLHSLSWCILSLGLLLCHRKDSRHFISSTHYSISATSLFYSPSPSSVLACVHVSSDSSSLNFILQLQCPSD